MEMVGTLEECGHFAIVDIFYSELIVLRPKFLGSLG